MMNSNLIIISLCYTMIRLKSNEILVKSMKSIVKLTESYTFLQSMIPCIKSSKNESHCNNVHYIMQLYACISKSLFC